MVKARMGLNMSKYTLVYMPAHAKILQYVTYEMWTTNAICRPKAYGFPFFNLFSQHLHVSQGAMGLTFRASKEHLVESDSAQNPPCTVRAPKEDPNLAATAAMVVPQLAKI